VLDVLDLLLALKSSDGYDLLTLKSSDGYDLLALKSSDGYDLLACLPRTCTPANYPFYSM
jgi:hypothetical protein